MERRFITELRSSGRSLEGRAVKFNTPARIGPFTEVIAPGAFTNTLKSGRDVMALIDHDMTKLLARSKSGNLVLTEDAEGLLFSIALPETSAAQDLLALAKRNELSGASIGFLIPANGEQWDGTTRRLTQIDLREVSILTGLPPAHSETSVTARSKTPRLSLALRYLETVR